MGLDVPSMFKELQIDFSSWIQAMQNMFDLTWWTLSVNRLRKASLWDIKLCV